MPVGARQVAFAVSSLILKILGLSNSAQIVPLII
jgi:hypothetical protein